MPEQCFVTSDVCHDSCYMSAQRVNMSVTCRCVLCFLRQSKSSGEQRAAIYLRYPTHRGTHNWIGGIAGERRILISLPHLTMCFTSQVAHLDSWVWAFFPLRLTGITVF